MLTFDSVRLVAKSEIDLVAQGKAHGHQRVEHNRASSLAVAQDQERGGGGEEGREPLQTLSNRRHLHRHLPLHHLPCSFLLEAGLGNDSAIEHMYVYIYT